MSDWRAAGLTAALVVGDQNAIDRGRLGRLSDHRRRAFNEHFRAPRHDAWLAAWLLGWLWRRSEVLCLAFPAPSAALLGGLLLATAYAVFSGWGGP